MLQPRGIILQVISSHQHNHPCKLKAVTTSIKQQLYEMLVNFSNHCNLNKSHTEIEQEREGSIQESRDRVRSDVINAINFTPY